MSSQDAWSHLMKALDADPRLAADRLQALLTRLVRIFEWRGCQEPDEAAYDVLDRVADKIRGGVHLTSSIERYAAGFVHPVFHERLRRRLREASMLEKLPVEPQLTGLSFEEEEQLGCLDDCLASELSEEEQEMVLLFHAESGAARIKARREMAAERGKTINALRIEVFRLRQKLKKCLEKCVQKAPGKAPGKTPG